MTVDHVNFAGVLVSVLISVLLVLISANERVPARLSRAYLMLGGITYALMGLYAVIRM